MRKTTVGAAAVADSLIASVTLVSGGSATATTAGAGPAAAHTTTSGQGLRQTGLPVAVDPAADLTANPDRVQESWYVTAGATGTDSWPTT